MYDLSSCSVHKWLLRSCLSFVSVSICTAGGRGQDQHILSKHGTWSLSSFVTFTKIWHTGHAQHFGTKIVHIQNLFVTTCHFHHLGKHDSNWHRMMARKQKKSGDMDVSCWLWLLQKWFVLLAGDNLHCKLWQKLTWKTPHFTAVWRSNPGPTWTWLTIPWLYQQVLSYRWDLLSRHLLLSKIISTSKVFLVGCHWDLKSLVLILLDAREPVPDFQSLSSMDPSDASSSLW